MVKSSEVEVKSLILDNYERNAKTGLTIKYKTMNKMPPMSLIVITYPLTANFQSNVDIRCAVTVNN